MQFEDAPEDFTAPLEPPRPFQQHSRIDDESAAVDLSNSTLPTTTTTTEHAGVVETPREETIEEDYDSEEYYYSEDEEEEEEQYGLEDGLREVMDQDWADASGGKPHKLHYRYKLRLS
jgi:hypothetical protein